MKRLRVDLVAVLPAWVLARLLVFAGFVLANTLSDGLVLEPEPVQLDEGLGAWDGTFYRDIAEYGYESLPLEAVRFFPLYPLIGRALSPLFLGNHAAALVATSSVLALAVAVLTRRLVLLETRNERLATRAAWFMTLVPSAFVLVFAYSEALFLTATLAAFLALRSQKWWWAALAGVLAGLTRPFGLFLVLPALVEVWRHRGALHGKRLVGAGAALVGPLLGTGAYLLFTGTALDSWAGPFRSQSDFRGDLVDPVTRMARGVSDVFGDEALGDGLHLPFAVLALVLLALTFRYWPVSYGLFAAAIVIGAVSADNLNSLERYMLNAFPIVLTLAVVAKQDWSERSVLVLSGAGMVGLTTLALLGEYVP